MVIDCSSNVDNLIPGHINLWTGNPKSGYYLSSAAILAGCLTLVLVDVHKRRIRKRKKVRARLKHSKSTASTATSATTATFQVIKPGFLGLTGKFRGRS